MDEAMATISANGAQRQAAIRQQLGAVDLSTKDQDTAFLIELVGGIFGFLGIGYIYSGLTNAGLIRLIGLWILNFILWSVIGVLTAVLIGLCLIPLPFILNIALAYFSAKDLKESLIAAKAARGAAPAAQGPQGYLGPQNYEMPSSSVEADARDREL